MDYADYAERATQDWRKLVDEVADYRTGRKTAAGGEAIENKLIASLALVSRMADKLQEELDIYGISLSRYGDQQGALKELSDFELQLLTKALEVLRASDEASLKLDGHIGMSWRASGVPVPLQQLLAKRLGDFQRPLLGTHASGQVQARSDASRD